jgi:hypothetical protein
VLYGAQYPILETAITGRMGLAQNDVDGKKGSLLELKASEFPGRSPFRFIRHINS